MPVVHDPLASLGTWPINVYIGDRTYVIEAQSATVWLTTLLEEQGSVDAVVELLPMNVKAELEQAEIDGAIDVEDKRNAFREAVEVAAGRPWWVVLNYLSLEMAYWSRFHGRLLLSGLDPDRVSFGAYLDALHYALIENRDDQAAQKILNYLETPPPGVQIELDEQVEGDTFLAMLNQQR